jgi:hypothetical protein
MTREKALQVNKLLLKIEMLETIHDEILDLDSLRELGDESLEDELLAVVQARLDKALKELEDL